MIKGFESFGSLQVPLVFVIDWVDNFYSLSESRQEVVSLDQSSARLHILLFDDPPELVDLWTIYQKGKEIDIRKCSSNISRVLLLSFLVLWMPF